MFLDEENVNEGKGNMGSKVKMTVQVGRIFNACDYYRAYMPIRELDEHDRISAKLVNGFGLLDCYGSDLVLTYRPREQAILNISGPARWLNCEILADWDDDIFDIPSSNYCAPNFSGNDVRISSEIARKVIGITASTPRLASLLGQWNKKVTVIPNTADQNIINSLTKDWTPKTNDYFHIVWAGSVTHVEDQEVVVNPLRELLKKYNDIRVTFFGWAYNKLIREFPGRVNYHPMVELFFYLPLLRDMNPDLVIQPLIDHTFNYSKSNIRWLEAGSFGFPVLASDVPSFKSLGEEYCMTAPWEEAAWMEKMEWAYKNRPEIQKIGQRSKEVIQKHWTIQTMWKAWDEYYYSVLGGNPVVNDYTPDMKALTVEVPKA